MKAGLGVGNLPAAGNYNHNNSPDGSSRKAANRHRRAQRDQPEKTMVLALVVVQAFKKV